MYIKKSSNLLNIDYSAVLPSTDFRPIFHSVVTYSGKLNWTHSVPFWEAKFVEIRKDLEYSNYIPFASP